LALSPVRSVSAGPASIRELIHMESGSDDDPWDGLNDRTFTLNVFGFASLAWTAGAQRFYQPPTPDDAAVGDG
jgi:hypothetical protein